MTFLLKILLFFYRGGGLQLNPIHHTASFYTDLADLALLPEKDAASIVGIYI